MTLDELIVSTPTWASITDSYHAVVDHCFGLVIDTSQNVQLSALSRFINNNQSLGEKLDAAFSAGNAKAIRLKEMLSGETGGTVKGTNLIALAVSLGLSLSTEEADGMKELANTMVTRMVYYKLAESRLDVIKRAVSLKGAG